MNDVGVDGDWRPLMEGRELRLGCSLQLKRRRVSPVESSSNGGSSTALSQDDGDDNNDDSDNDNNDK
jgi:hypothetical protein